MELETGRINWDAVDTALAWRRWADMLSPIKMQRWEVNVDVSIGVGGGGMGPLIDTAARLREGAAALGPLWAKILDALIVRRGACEAQIGFRCPLVQLGDMLAATLNAAGAEPPSEMRLSPGKKRKRETRFSSRVVALHMP